MKGFMKKLSVAAIALAAVAAVAGTSITAEAAKKPTKITLKSTSKTVDIKGKVTVSVKSVKPAKASKSVTWKSSNKKVATVSTKGVVTGKKKGTVKITATSKKNKKVKATITVKVKSLKPTSVSLSSKTVSLKVGKSKTLTATVKPVGVYNKGITWKSSKPSVATVSTKGKITAKAEGSATITATTKEGSKKATCKVTVTKAEEVTPTPEEVQPIAEPNVTYNKVTAADLKKDITSENPEYIVVDVRKAADYAISHVITAISADVDSALPTTEELAAGRTVNAKAAASAGLTNIKAAIAANTANKKYAIICYTGNKYARAATTLLIASGIDNSKIFTLEGGIKAWNEAGNSAYTVSSGTGSDGKTYNYITAAQLKADVDSGSPVYRILDVRMKSKYEAGHIDGAVSASVNEMVNPTTNTDGSAKDNLAAAIKDDKTNVKYVLVCNSGKRYAEAATQILVDEFKINSSNIITLTGGMDKNQGGWSYATVK